MSKKFETRSGKQFPAVELSDGRVGVYYRPPDRKVWGKVKQMPVQYLVADMVNGQLVIRPKNAERVIVGMLVEVSI